MGNPRVALPFGHGRSFPVFSALRISIDKDVKTPCKGDSHDLRTILIGNKRHRHIERIREPYAHQRRGMPNIGDIDTQFLKGIKNRFIALSVRPHQSRHAVHGDGRKTARLFGAFRRQNADILAFGIVDGHIRQMLFTNTRICRRNVFHAHARSGLTLQPSQSGSPPLLTSRSAPGCDESLENAIRMRRPLGRLAIIPLRRHCRSQQVFPL